MFDRDDDHDCKVCSAQIPEGQTYCAIHYQEAMLQYQEALKQHELDLAEWEVLSPAEQLKLNTESDQSSLRKYALILSLAISVTTGVSFKLDPIPTLIFTVLIVLAVAFIKPIYLLVGRIGRGLKSGFVYTLITLVLLSILFWFTQDFPYPEEVMVGGSAACFIFSFWREGVGGHRVSARPIAPVKPQP